MALAMVNTYLDATRVRNRRANGRGVVLNGPQLLTALLMADNFIHISVLPRLRRGSDGFDHIYHGVHLHGFDPLTPAPLPHRGGGEGVNSAMLKN
jgi:hypothetical protein